MFSAASCRGGSERHRRPREPGPHPDLPTAQPGRVQYRRATAIGSAATTGRCRQRARGGGTTDARSIRRAGAIDGPSLGVRRGRARRQRHGPDAPDTCATAASRRPTTRSRSATVTTFAKQSTDPLAGRPLRRERRPRPQGDERGRDPPGQGRRQGRHHLRLQNSTPFGGRAPGGSLRRARGAIVRSPT
jgi:hypothetical protein